MFRLTCVLLFLFSYQFVAQAVDAPIILPRDESNCADAGSKRTLFDIVWGCVSTTIICAWAAVHPNIPPREGPLKATLRRLELVFWMILAPEIFPCWALNQRLAAMTVRDVYNEGNGYRKDRSGIWKTVKGWFSLYEIKEATSQVWTLKHGHYLIMGGMHLVEPPNTATDQGARDVQPSLVNTDTERGRSGRVTILTLEMLRELVKDPEFKIRITEEEITHRSKGNALFKIIFILHSTWFILQCLGRRAQGLDLTHLELITLALTSLNGITFVLWWDKPFGAQAVLRVHLKRKLTDSEREAGYRHRVRSGSILNLAVRYFEGHATTIRDIILSILSLLLSPIIIFVVYTIDNLILGQSSSLPADATHVPTLYVPSHRYSAFFEVLLLMALGTIVGGIHCAGWNLFFSTHPEQKLWRIASLAVTVIPFVAPFTGIIVIVVSIMLARFVLLGLALALLRHLPPIAFITFDWTKFYPHIL